MPSRTALFQQLPWVGGLATSLDESMIPHNQLTVADNLIFDVRGSRKKRDGIKHNYDDVTTGSAPLVGLHEFWYGTGTSGRTQRRISVASDRTVRSYNAGAATSLTVAGTAWSGTLTNCSMVTFNNRCIIAVNISAGSTNVVKMYSGSGNVEDLTGSPPKGSILREHLGRLWMNDKENKDRLHYSPTHDHTLWNGAGDSGALDIGVGDGDPDGITAIFPTFKGELFVAKRTRLYRVSGQTPETFQVTLVSSGVGCVSHNSIAQIDQDDMMFVSEKGIHSLGTTASYGDFESTFVSTDIQKTFNELNRSRLKFSWGAYLDNINSVAFALSTSGASTNDVVYLYNIPNKAWFRWSSISCESMIVGSDSDKKRFYFGTSTTRLSKSFNGTNYDISASGTNTAISFRVTTGLIVPDSNPYVMKGFKRFILYYRPTGTFSLTVSVKIDNISLSPENSLSFTSPAGVALLGSTFILGSSVLGSGSVLGPYSFTIDGFGRAFKVDITQDGVDQQIEIQGFAIEYEIAGPVAEVF